MSGIPMVPKSKAEAEAQEPRKKPIVMKQKKPSVVKKPVLKKKEMKQTKVEKKDEVKEAEEVMAKAEAEAKAKAEAEKPKKRTKIRRSKVNKEELEQDPLYRKALEAQENYDRASRQKKLTSRRDAICKEFEKLTVYERTIVLTQLGLGKTYFTCNKCGKVLGKKHFFTAFSEEWKSGVCPICIDCAKDIAIPMNDNGVRDDPSRDRMELACFYLDKPMLDIVWDSAVRAMADPKSQYHGNLFGAYFWLLTGSKYKKLCYRDSDVFTKGLTSFDKMLETHDEIEDKEIMDSFEKNKKDVLRLLGYLPFEKEKLIDQPYLYAQLVGFLDASEEANDDMMRIQSIISIVRGFSQASNIDDAIARLSDDQKVSETHINTIKNLQSMKSSIMTSVISLAKESCISLKNSKNTTKGDNTWTGKMQKLEDLDFKEYEINGYDIETCKGMRQVADISIKAIIDSLHLDESEYSEMLAQQTERIYKLEKDKDGYQEVARILLKENLDLRDALKNNNIPIEEDMVNLNNIVNNYFVDDNGSLK